MVAPVSVLGIANLLMHLEATNVAVPSGLGWRLGLAACDRRGNHACRGSVRRGMDDTASIISACLWIAAFAGFVFSYGPAS